MPVFNQPLLTRLLGSIEAGNLVVLCGAGLSIPGPSNLMSAVGVSRACYDKWVATEPLPQNMRENIDALAAHFYTAGTLQSVFIQTLVPWDGLVGEPNAGHAAVADFLICRAAHAALSSNFDPLIEQWSNTRKIAMRGALTGVEAVQFNANTSPLVKFHGCLNRGRADTLWTQGQLNEAAVQLRVGSCSQWINLHLPGKDLLIVGFWTDWGYLNDVLANAFAVQNAASVTVVDISTTAELQTKAPTLWQKLMNAGGPFEHVEASATDALAELRTEFSKVWARKFFQLAEPFVQVAGGIYDPMALSPALWTCEELYDLRRDAEGMPYDHAARGREPPAEAATAAYMHWLLTAAGATRDRGMYVKDGQRVRVVHGAGKALESVRQTYNEPPALANPDIVVCVGAQVIGTPGSVIASGTGASIVRPAPGGGARWLTFEEGRAELNV
ncbi:MAG TPA: SIR2 family protein [Xanthobacteraceae bacterium]|jgi:hypothetical protein|nr:SIR2 family protein [Xanthobacteraceae bacterium]